MGKYVRGRNKSLFMSSLLVFLALAAAVMSPGVWITSDGGVAAQQQTVPPPTGGEVLDLLGEAEQTLDSPTGDVSIVVPLGAVDPGNPITLVYGPEDAPGRTPPSDPEFLIGHVFGLEVWQYGTAGPWLTGYSFGGPVSVQINYTGDDVTAAGGKALRVASNAGGTWALLGNQQTGAGFVNGEIQDLSSSDQITWFALVAPAWAATTASASADASKYGIVPLVISGVYDADNDPVTIPGVGSYAATVDYSAAGVEMKAVRGGSAPFDAPVVNIQATQTTINQTQATAQPQPPSTVAYLVPSLTGSALDIYNIVTTFDSFADTSGDSIWAPAPVSNSYLRGDTNFDGTVNVVDALFIAQYVVGARALSTINAVNAASPRHDDATGDKVSIVDALYIAQYKAVIRNASYDWLL